MPACRREVTVLSLAEILAAAEENTFCLAVMLYGDGGLPTCFDSRHLRGACLRLCIHHQTHGCA